MKVSIVLGTRPEIIKMTPIVRQLEKKGLDFFILHTGQHYSYNMDKVFFEQLMLPQPKYNLEVGSGTHAEETGKMLVGVEGVLLMEKPDIVLVKGDTNTERPETIEVGANVLAGTEPKEILEKAKMMTNVKRDWENPFGDRKAATRIINIISEIKPKLVK